MNAATVEYGNILPGMVRLEPGDVVLYGDEPNMVVGVNDCAARICAPHARTKTITDRVFGTSVQIETKPVPFRISNTVEKRIVPARQGAEGLAYFLTHRAVRGFEKTKTVTAEGEQTYDNRTKSNSRHRIPVNAMAAGRRRLRRTRWAGRLKPVASMSRFIRLESETAGRNLPPHASNNQRHRRHGRLDWSNLRVVQRLLVLTTELSDRRPKTYEHRQ